MSNPRPSTRAQGAGPSIVIVESDALVRRIFRQVLEAQHYTVMETGVAREALPLCAQRDASLAIIDTLLPEQQGWELILTLRRQWPSLPILALIAGSKASEHATLAANAHIDRFLQKPFTPSEMVRVVREMIDGPPP